MRPVHRCLPRGVVGATGHITACPLTVGRQTGVAPTRPIDTFFRKLTEPNFKEVDWLCTQLCNPALALGGLAWGHPGPLAPVGHVCAPTRPHGQVAAMCMHDCGTAVLLSRVATPVAPLDGGAGGGGQARQHARLQHTYNNTHQHCRPTHCLDPALLVASSLHTDIYLQAPTSYSATSCAWGGKPLSFGYSVLHTDGGPAQCQTVQVGIQVVKGPPPLPYTRGVASIGHKGSPVGTRLQPEGDSSLHYNSPHC